MTSHVATDQNHLVGDCCVVDTSTTADAADTSRIGDDDVGGGNGAGDVDLVDDVVVWTLALLEEILLVVVFGWLFGWWWLWLLLWLLLFEDEDCMTASF